MFTRYLLPAAAVVAFGFAIIQMTYAQQKPPPVSPPVEPGRSPFGSQVAGVGLVEPETENISVGTPLPGVVQAVRVRVDDGVRVKAGQVLFELDDRQLRAELAARQAALTGARAQLAKTVAHHRKQEEPPLDAKLAEAKANLEDKTALYTRVKAGGSLSAEELNSRRMAVEVAKTQVQKAAADLDLLRAGAWEVDRLVAEAAVAQAEAAVAQTTTELARLKVTAPRVHRPDVPPTRDPIPEADLVEFKVLQVNVRPGEFVSAGGGLPLVVLGTVGRLHARVDIDENDIGRFRRSAPGVATARGAAGKSFPLRFVRVEPYVIPKKSLTGGNVERVDTRVLQVIYAIDAPTPDLYVGQQLDVALDTGGK